MATPRCQFAAPRRLARPRTHRSLDRAPAFELCHELAQRQATQTRLTCGTRSNSTYGCFLPDLTRFMAPRRAGPDRQHRLTRAVPMTAALEQEFNPAVADCGYRAPLAPHLARPRATVAERRESGQDAGARSLTVLLGQWLERNQQVAGFDPLSGLQWKRFHNRIDGRTQLIVHLHGLDHEKHVALFHRVAYRTAHLDD